MKTIEKIGLMVAVVALVAASLVLDDPWGEGRGWISLSRRSGGGGVADPVPTFKLGEGPPLPEAPALAGEPLVFTGFEPPYTSSAIPAALLQACLARNQQRFDEAGETEASFLGVEFLELSLAVATLDSGIEVWVHTSRIPGAPHMKFSDVWLFDRSAGRLGGQTVSLETKARNMKLEDLTEMLSQADLDFDGRAELVVRELDHPGSDISNFAQHWFAVDDSMQITRLLITAQESNITWNGWRGRFLARVIPASANEVWVQAWYSPHDAGVDLPLGHSCYTREQPGDTFTLSFEVINPDAPARDGDGFGSFGERLDARSVVRVRDR